MVQYGVVWCSVLQCGAFEGRMLRGPAGVLQCVAGVLQCVAVWCSVVQYGAAWCIVVHVLRCVAVVLQCGAVWCSIVQCVAVCCSVVYLRMEYQGALQVCSRVLQCVAGAL